MRATAIRWFALAIGVGLLSAAAAQAATTPRCSGGPTATKAGAGVVLLAESNTRSSNKLADKYMAGRAGGRYGIGGSESVVFKKKKKK
jgi:hypothetical protein